MSVLRQVLAQLREEAKTQREKGDYFERLALHYLKHDRHMRAQYENPQLFSEWAKEHGKDGRDTGIDIVAKIRDEEGYCAVQCKFRKEGANISRAELDSFLAASGTSDFKRRIIIDTTNKEWGKLAESVLDRQDKPLTRINIFHLEDSDIDCDWAAWLHGDKVRSDRGGGKKPRPDQREAIEAVCKGLEESDRGKLVLPCGTGKTFTSLQIAEKIAGEGKAVLFLVPSLALMSQTIHAWSYDANDKIKQRCLAVCSDTKVDNRRKNDDSSEIKIHDLIYPPTTDAAKLADKAKDLPGDQMTVVFATYQSIQVISDAQKKHGLWEFDLIICDEAHRTTGATLIGKGESNFVKVHDQKHIRGKKRLYMTATPRVFGDAAKSKASEASVEICSMDDEKLFGATLFSRKFGWAVKKGLLTDYKVIVLGVDEEMISSSLQNALADESSELKLDDANKIIGCYRALAKLDQKEFGQDSNKPMSRALAFCRDIKSSKLIEEEFSKVVSEYLSSSEGRDAKEKMKDFRCDIRHVDGTFNAKLRSERIDWLKHGDDNNVCRVLSNARCLAEGVDVPSLDAVLFMHPRKSQIDVVQSVGRVMRCAEDKEMGYIILPIGIPAGLDPSKALDDNKRYRLVWDTLNALRSHDERLEWDIDKLGLGEDISNRIEIIAITNTLPQAEQRTDKSRVENDTEAKPQERNLEPVQGVLSFEEWSRAVIARMVTKCGRVHSWDEWAKNISIIAQTHISRIKGVIANPGSEREGFDLFLKAIKKDLNESVTEDEAVEMLAQHLITRPVFESLFNDHGFVRRNPVSQAMQQVLNMLSSHNIDKEAESLDEFYDTVRERVAGIESPKAKQKLVAELYDKFFRYAFPKMTDRLGIAYTPVDIVDFILRSVDEILRRELGQTIGSRGVHVIDPFVGTGTFITRLLQSGLVGAEQMEHKYKHELHANEVVLLAYYIASLNIEEAYRRATETKGFQFEGICLTDTFQLYENDSDFVSDLLADNSGRRLRQKELSDIRVIIGNPPYSIGQDSANNDSANAEYPKLDEQIRNTYASHVSGNKRSLYDSYVRAIRWASDRIGDKGVIAYITNAGWLDNKIGGGLRVSLPREFSSIYVFHLRGNQRTSGELSRKEGGKIFGSASRAPIGITFLVKKPGHSGQGKIYFYDIGDSLSREEKLSRISEIGDIGTINKMGTWSSINPDSYGDWFNQRQPFPELSIAMGGSEASFSIFSVCGSGVVTSRDPWVYNDSQAKLAKNMKRMANFYNHTVDNPDCADFNDPRKISWSRGLKASHLAGRKHSFKENKIGVAMYRPFNLRHFYYDRGFIENVSRMPQMFPDFDIDNRVIYVTGLFSAGKFSALMTKYIPNIHLMTNGQCFPLGVSTQDSNTMFAGSEMKTALTDEGLSFFKSAYPGKKISKEELFYYVYGFIHSQDYRKAFANTLAKELPKIMPVKSYEDFCKFVEAGRELGELHCDFEDAAKYPVEFKKGGPGLIKPSDPLSFYRVIKMKFAGKRSDPDKRTVVYNSNITVSGIPLKAYDYVINGKSALEWVMDRQKVAVDKASGIENDPNAFANEARGNPAYPLELFQRVITVSLETMKIVKSLPPLDLKD